MVYHGVFGTGLFQTIYRRPASIVAMMMMSIEWHLLAGFTLMLALAFAPLFFVALGDVSDAGGSGRSWPRCRRPMPRHRHWLTRPLIAYLHFRQPIARGWARYSVAPEDQGAQGTKPAAIERHAGLPFDPADRRTLRVLEQRTSTACRCSSRSPKKSRAAGWRVRIDSGWHDWDMEIYGSRYVKVRLTTATEHHHGNGMLTRVPR